MNGAILLSVSLLFIGLELFFTRILNLKTWNHVVYVVIPFAMLGYGVGANLYLIGRPLLRRFDERRLLQGALWIAALTSVGSTLLLIHIPVQLRYLDTIFVQLDSIVMLIVAYTILMIPFVVIGFLVVAIFQAHPSQASRLYFFDLLGAGIGAFAFFVLIGRFQVLHSIVLLSLLVALLAAAVAPRRSAVSLVCCAFIASIFVLVPEPTDYRIDPAKGWEWVPGFFDARQYEHSLSRWHPMGRTDVFRIVDHELSAGFLEGTGRIQSASNPDEEAYVTAGTFEINLVPPPEVAYVSTNFLAGTPIYKMSPAGVQEHGSRLNLFSQPMEVPYVLLRDPSVVIIGAGGGRDIFLARTHGAKAVVGAEINPAIHSIMSPGGDFYEYSGGVYGADGVQVFNTDGRHLVKNLPANSFDLVVLNGVDTYSGLSTGAYAYAESYLYTKNAIKDYLALLDDRGIIDFNRWFSVDEMPKENLRLFVNVMGALRESGADKPWDHVMIGDDRSWAMTLIKKTPFTAPERERVQRYFLEHGTRLIHPIAGDPRTQDVATRTFALYVQSLKEGHEQQFIDRYPFDISVVTDDKPFFYKHYKLRSFNPFQRTDEFDVGPVMFLTQFLILAQASLFILVFLFVPLAVFRRQGIRRLPSPIQWRFAVYFACLGLGFMFIEIPVMQRFTLLLGSPIHSISVTLVSLLVATGTGSLLLPRLRERSSSPQRLVRVATAGLVLYLAALVLGTGVFERFMHHGFAVRSLIVMASVFPLGLLLGIFFPLGLELVGTRYEQTIPWAWGINSGFSVLGGIGAIILAQLIGFNMVLMLACLVYLVAGHSLTRLLESVGADA